MMEDKKSPNYTWSNRRLFLHRVPENRSKSHRSFRSHHKNPADPNVGPGMQKIVSLLIDLEHQNICLHFNIRRMRP